MVLSAVLKPNKPLRPDVYSSGKALYCSPFCRIGYVITLKYRT
jgi:hypothetical protein